ncbi:MAG: hypothetical protein WBF73_19875 [Bradyrhizobium sp.]|jgi:hypothetical protein
MRRQSTLGNFVITELLCGMQTNHASGRCSKTVAEVLGGLVKAFRDYQQKSERLGELKGLAS